MHSSLPTFRRITVVATIAAIGCSRADARTDPSAGTQTAAETASSRPVHVDSILPIEEEIRRFREDIDPVSELGVVAPSSRDALVALFVESLERGDEAALAGMRLTRAEFAYLYYPYTRFARPPYELPPAFVWFQIEQNDAKGFRRLLRTWGTMDLGFRGYACSEPVLEGPNRVWESCTIDVARADGSVNKHRLFGSILENGGHFKFISFANDL